MMLKQKSTSWRKLKLAGFLPLAAIAVTAFARPEVSNELEKLSAVKIHEFIPEEKTPIAQSAQADSSETKNPIPDNTSFYIDGEAVDKDAVDNLPIEEIENVEVFKQPSSELAERFNLRNMKNGVVLITTRRTDSPKLKILKDSQDDFHKKLTTALILVDREVFNGDISSIDPSTIETISVLKNEGALDHYVEKYGVKAKNGVILIKLKKF